MNDIDQGKPLGVSVIVPVYNAEASLEECINSLLELKYPRDAIELIFIDNNSTDRSLEILKKYPGRITILTEQARGSSAARNTGVAHARHGIIAFIDADCKADSLWLTHLVKPFEENPLTGAVGGKIISKEPANDIERFGDIVHNHKNAIVGHCPPYLITMNMAVRKLLLIEAGGFDISFLRGQDSELTFRLYKRNCQFVYVDDALVSHSNEKTLKGLYAEGFLHGSGVISLIRKHPDYLVITMEQKKIKERHSGAVSFMAKFLKFIFMRKHPDYLVMSTKDKEIKAYDWLFKSRIAILISSILSSNSFMFRMCGLYFNVGKLRGMLCEIRKNA